jgi:acid stress-induced BolA-like protein IbaG/YrbA
MGRNATAKDPDSAQNNGRWTVFAIMRVMNPEQVAELIRAGLPGAEVLVQSEDNTHFAARVIAADFAGKRPIARHQLVYRTLGELMGREIHAMSIEALTPEEFAARS